MQSLTFRDYKMYVTLENRAKNLLQQRMGKARHGNEPAYMHSYRVHNTVLRLHHWDDPDYDLFLAALLHRIIHDSKASCEELLDLGFTSRTIRLASVGLCPPNIIDPIARQTFAVSKLIQASCEEAWIIMIVATADSIRSRFLSLEEDFLINVLAPLILALTEKYTYLHRYRRELKIAARIST